MFRWPITLLALVLLAGPAAAQKGKFKLTDAPVKTTDFVYKKTPQGELTLHGFFPPDWTPADKRPVVVFFFGGGWKNGTFTQFVPHAEYFASRGLVALSADYRIESKHKTGPEKAVEDAKSAIRWVRANAGKLGIDPGKVIAGGGSAGGHLAAATALVAGFDSPDDPKVSAKPNALVLFNPFLDGTGLTIKGTDGSNVADAISTTPHLTKDAPPTVIFFGTNDKLLVQGKDYVAKAKPLGVRAELWTAEGQPHTFFNRPPWNQLTTRKADEFLASLDYIKGEPTIKLPGDGSKLELLTVKTSAARLPNVVVILADDLGYGDLGCYGSKVNRTPNLDRMAAEGTRFTNLYVAQPVCTASRAALLTGCYPNRVSLFGALNHQSKVGISPKEVLLPELLKKQGYATAIYGKWHLGDRPPFLPTRRGFDDWQGLPYSNDNGPLHPVVKGIPPLPWYHNEAVVETDPDQSKFTRRITDLGVKFIEANKDRPFFLYLPHVMPHVPIFASEKFKGKSSNGLYGDVVEELDAGIGEVLAAIKKNGLDDNTLVFFFSDNGPFLSYGTHAGTAGRLREGKLTTWDGGVRVPALARWPGKVPAGRVCDEPLMNIDLLPTIAKLAGAGLPPMPIDGLDVGPVLFGEPGAKSPHEAYFFFGGDELHAVLAGKWKLHLPHEYLTVNGPPGTNGKPAGYPPPKPEAMTVSGLRGIASRHGYKVAKTGLALYDVAADPGETTDVAAKHPEVVQRLLGYAEKARADLGDALTGRKGPGVRACGVVE